jgi:hypothetical protein
VKVAGRGSGRFDGFGVWSFAAGRGPFGAVVRVGLADGSARVARGEAGPRQSRVAGLRLRFPATPKPDCDYGRQYRVKAGKMP